MARNFTDDQYMMVIGCDVMTVDDVNYEFALFELKVLCRIHLQTDPCRRRDPGDI